MTRTILLAAIAVTLLAVVASGCGSSGSSGEGVADLDTGASAAAQTTTTEQQTEDPQEAALEWARCMREHGVDVPDPQVDKDGGLTVKARTGRRVKANNAEFREAIEACGNPLGNARPQLTDDEREQLQETMLEFARCMREHGVDMPDPQFSGGGGLFRVGGRGRGVDPDDPEFRAAQEACEPIMQELKPLGGRKTG
jgi:hypothetical protein